VSQHSLNGDVVALDEPNVLAQSGELDAAEVARGADAGRPRVKFTSVVDMLAAAGATDDQSRESRRPNVIRRLLGVGRSVPVGDVVPPRNRLR
jgi:hypothetical protein